MFHAVFLLVAASQLMFFYTAVHVVVDICCDDYAVLGPAVHGLCIYIIMFFFILHEPSALLERIEIFHGPVVDRRVVFVGAFGEIDFRLDDVVKRFRIAFGFCACFRAVQYVVGARRYFRHHPARRTDALERFHFCHFCFSGFKGWVGALFFAYDCLFAVRTYR